MHFAVGTWLVALVVVPALWLAFQAADRRARERSKILLGERAGDHREDWNPRVRSWRRFLYLAAVAGLILALARPQWGASEVTVTQRGRDVVVALDISNSMLAEDVTPSRLERAKAELTAFLRSQKDSRVGLVLFAGGAFVQCPLTADYGTAEIFLQMAAPDMISSQGTALATALSTSRELLLSGRAEGGAKDFQAILLVTDGEDLEGNWEAEVQACQREGITVIPVGIGEETGGLIPVTDDQGRPAGFLKDDDGQLVLSRIDLTSLERLASMGGGSTFRVGLDGLAGERLRTVLERLGRRDFEQRQVTAWQDRYHWPLGLALLSLMLAVLVRPRHRISTAMVLAGLLMGMLNASPVHAEIVRPPGAEAAQRGQAAYLAGDFNEALKEFQTARALSPEDARLALAVGEALYHLERYEEATREFERARQMTDIPELQAESLYNAGTTALIQGDTEGAVEHLRESLRLEPMREDALRNLEAALLQQQQQQQQQQQDQDQEQQEDQEKKDDEEQEQEQDQQDQQDQEQQQDQEPQDQEQEQDQEQQQPQEEQQEPPAEDQPQPEPEPSQEELDKEQALQLLKALDRDEQELKRSVQRRLHGGPTKSGKRW